MVISMSARNIVRLAQHVYREPNMLEVSQILWMGIDEHEKTVVLTPVHKEDLQLMGNGYSYRDAHEQKIVRLFQGAKNRVHCLPMPMLR
jgi:hypothetical protein